MHDELIRGLRICESGDKCDLCPKWLDKQNGGLNACTSALSKDAADAIEELKKDLERGHDYYEFWKHKAEQESKMLQVAISNMPCWIPVTERLPEKYTRVLVYSKRIRLGRNIDFMNEDGDWHTIPEVTHWMPLPESPKEE